MFRISDIVYKLTHAGQQKRAPEDGPEAGWAIIDITVALLIVGGFVGAALYGGSLLAENRRQGRWEEQLSQVVQKVRQMYSGQTSMGTVDITTTLLNAGVFPGDMVTGTSVFNPWDGAVTVTGATTTFLVSSAGLSQKACINAATRNSNSSTDLGITALRIGSTDISTFPITPTVAEASCAASGNTLRWTLRMRG